MKLAAHAAENKGPAEMATPSGGPAYQRFTPPSLPPAVLGTLSIPKEERKDQASAAPDLAAADCAWNYASLRTLDFSLMPPSPSLQRFHAWHFGARYGL